MKKKKGVRKKKKREFFSHEKKSLVIGVAIVLAFFILSFLVGFVGFDNSSSVTGHDIWNIGGDYNIFADKGTTGPTSGGRSTGIFSTTSNLIVAKYILFFMIAMGVYWAIDAFVKKGSFSIFKLLFSFAVGYLAIAFITLDEVYSFMATYSALGALFSVVIPFVIVLMITSRLVTDGILTTGKVLIQRAIWIVYVIFLFYYLISTVTGGGIRANPFLNFIIGIIALAALLIAIFNTKFVKFLHRVRKRVNDANIKAKLEEAKRIAAETQHKEELHKITNDLKKQQAVSKRLGREIEDFYRYS